MNNKLGIQYNAHDFVEENWNSIDLIEGTFPVVVEETSGMTGYNSTYYKKIYRYKNRYFLLYFRNNPDYPKYNPVGAEIHEVYPKSEVVTKVHYLSIKN